MKTQVTAALEADLALDFECLVEATMASKAGLVRLALRDFIDAAVAKNKGIGTAFALAKARRTGKQHGHLTVVK